MNKKKLIKQIESMSELGYKKWLKDHNLDHQDVDSNWFEVFWNKFPQKTPKGRVLRAKSSKAYTAKIAKDLYNKAVRNEEQFKMSIIGLQNDIIQRTVSKDLEYINNITTYIRSRRWEDYIDIDKPVEEQSIEEEGTNFEIT